MPHINARLMESVHSRVRPQGGKPPKLRFKPGQMLKHKQTGEIVCIRVAYRSQANPHEWLFVLEDRENIGKPSTKLSTAVEQLAGEGMRGCLVIWELVREHNCCQLPGTENFYWFGSCSTKSNKHVLNNYQVVSSGEVE